ncbi:secondary thiamine-phosphate synthase enzyme [Azospirillum fermentarium]|uniref:secondary thiamine-phosphate synthase enzyme YjbQ n=1 Tax=Azospirillum fermentarium TaxID=1233114 RepID=UPI0022262F4E|nr:secondary thiamine-phosphate synthase enzyme YjbQ [Azospirillum fermentarium]MCW2245740.1 secondary thiamine-phosphate synthase enzyme [Azospirillum fermentarium]
MRQAMTTLNVPTRGQGLVEITAPVVRWVGEQGIGCGLLTLYCRHTSASLVIQENADPDVRGDLERFFARLVREDPALYDHTLEGPDDMPAHIRSALTAVSLSIPVADGRPVLGTWQGIYLFEHRTHRHDRQVTAHLFGE